MKTVARTLVEALVVVAAGLVIGLAANAVSPQGLKLTRDYFPRLPAPDPAPPATPTNALPAQDLAAAPDPVAPSPPGQPSTGPQTLDHEQVLELHQDPLREADLILFLDTRNPAQYRDGHLPGAYLFYHYRLENHLQDVLPLCQVADLVVLYCNGGDCEDSKLAAAALIHLGIRPDILRIYGDGFVRWRAEGLPIEVGQRLSGQFLEPAHVSPP